MYVDKARRSEYEERRNQYDEEKLQKQLFENVFYKIWLVVSVILLIGGMFLMMEKATRISGDVRVKNYFSVISLLPFTIIFLVLEFESKIAFPGWFHMIVYSVIAYIFVASLLNPFIRADAAYFIFVHVIVGYINFWMFRHKVKELGFIMLFVLGIFYLGLFILLHLGIII